VVPLDRRRFRRVAGGAVRERLIALAKKDITGQERVAANVVVVNEVLEERLDLGVAVGVVEAETRRWLKMCWLPQPKFKQPSIVLMKVRRYCSHAAAASFGTIDLSETGKRSLTNSPKRIC
jgi:hypothetical protein